MDKLREGLKALGLEGAREERLLRDYKAEIEVWNTRYGLVNAEGEDLVVRHMLDSLAPAPFLKRGWWDRVADIGSGAGFPGIPLAICFPQWSFHLIERSNKRCGFLRNVVLTLGLENVVVQERAFEALQGRYNLLTFRAFTPLEQGTLQKMLPLLADRGRIMAYKGRAERLKEELRPWNRKAAFRFEVQTIKVPFLEEERHLVWFQVL